MESIFSLLVAARNENKASLVIKVSVEKWNQTVGSWLHCTVVSSTKGGHRRPRRHFYERVRLLKFILRSFEPSERDTGRKTSKKKSQRNGQKSKMSWRLVFVERPVLRLELIRSSAALTLLHFNAIVWDKNNRKNSRLKWGQNISNTCLQRVRLWSGGTLVFTYSKKTRTQRTFFSSCSTFTVVSFFFRFFVQTGS